MLFHLIPVARGFQLLINSCRSQTECSQGLYQAMFSEEILHIFGELDEFMRSTALRRATSARFLSVSVIGCPELSSSLTN